MAGRSTDQFAKGQGKSQTLSGRTGDRGTEEAGRNENKRLVMRKVPKVAKKRQRTSYKAVDYSYVVMWSEQDNAFIGRVTEFASLAAHGSTQEKALREIRTVVGYVLGDMVANGEPVPEPLGKRRYSGKLNVRMSADLHRRLSIESEHQGVSLNALINQKLAT